MFHRMFGRRRSPVEGEPNADSGTEATEGQADIVNSDDFVLLGEMLFFSLFFFSPSLFLVCIFYFSIVPFLPPQHLFLHLFMLFFAVASTHLCSSKSQQKQ